MSKVSVRRSDAVDFMRALAQKDTMASLVLFDPPDSITDGELFQSVSEATRVVRSGGSLVFLGSPQTAFRFASRCAPSGLRSMADVAVLWSTPAKGKRATNIVSKASTISWFVKPGFRGRTFETVALPSNVIVAEPVPFAERYNPAQKPVELFNYILSVMSDNSGPVIDPFCGAGSSLVSASIVGRDALACDIDPEQVESSKNRLVTIEDEQANLRPLYWWMGRGRYKIVGE